MKSEDYVIIVAGGKGLRMGSDIPKQFLPIGGRPVLMRTLERFRAYSPTLNIILVLPEAQQGYWRQLCEQHQFKVDYQLANGGQTRFHSVQNGLALVPDDAEGVVGVHDGVRPFPSLEVIRNCFETARSRKAAVPVIPVVETVRRLVPASDAHGSARMDKAEIRENPWASDAESTVHDPMLASDAHGSARMDKAETRENPWISDAEATADKLGDASDSHGSARIEKAETRENPWISDAESTVHGPMLASDAHGSARMEEAEIRENPWISDAKRSMTVPRDEYRLVQTPQTFDIQLLKAANRQPYNDGFTDDASVVESYGHNITLVEGNRENIKITTPYDLVIGEAIWSRMSTDQHGQERHP